MSHYAALLSSIDEKGANFMVHTRNRMRTAYMAAKAYAKLPNWTETDDIAFNSIESMTADLAKEAGYSIRAQAPAAMTIEYAITTATVALLEAELAKRGYRIIGAPSQLPTIGMPATAPVNLDKEPAEPFNLEAELKAAASMQRPSAFKLKPDSFA